MKAHVVTNQTPVGQRSFLAEQLPLSTPYMVQIFPVYACNFRCNYCVLSLPKTNRGYISDNKFLDFNLYQKCVRDIQNFPGKLRMLRFAGTGEPLLHPKLPEMIAFAVEAQISESIDIVTNASLLTPCLSKKLVDSGVNRIRISIQGVTSKKYREITGVYAELDQIISNITYLHSIRGKVELYVKIIDSALENPEDEQVFYELFGNISDVLSVEHLLPATPLIEYSRIAGSARMNKTQNGAAVARTNICPQPFYMMQINPDGVAVPCCGMESPIKLAQLADTSLVDVWHGKILNRFRHAMLTNQRCKNSVCASCEQFRFAMFPEDVLDESANRLITSNFYI